MYKAWWKHSNHQQGSLGSVMRKDVSCVSYFTKNKVSANYCQHNYFESSLDSLSFWQRVGNAVSCSVFLTNDQLWPGLWGNSIICPTPLTCLRNITTPALLSGVMASNTQEKKCIMGWWWSLKIVMLLLVMRGRLPRPFRQKHWFEKLPLGCRVTVQLSVQPLNSLQPVNHLWK